MRILHICPSSRLESPLAPESLQYLGHQIERRGLDQLTAAGAPAKTRTPTRAESRKGADLLTDAASESTDPDVVVADACLDLSLAPTIAEALAQSAITAPIIVVLSEGGLATASAKWDVADIVLTTAGPAEVEARLRLARDRHLAAGQPGTSGRALTPGQSRTQGQGRSAGQLRTDGSQWGGSGSWAEPGFWPNDSEPTVVVSGDLRIDETAFTADLGGRSLDLTYREFALLKFFALHPERVFTRDEILLTVWGDDYYGGTRTVDVHVRRLRAKLGKDLENAIHTVRNVGYRFSPDSAAANSDDDEDEPQSASETEPQSAPGSETAPEPESTTESNEKDVKV